MKLTISLDDTARVIVQHYAKLHGTTVAEAAAALIVTGGRRRRASLRYIYSPKGEIALARSRRKRAGKARPSKPSKRRWVRA